jgi:integrase
MRSVADQHILPSLGRIKVRDLTADKVAQWYRDVANRCTAIRMALSTLSGLMLYAEDHGLRESGSNPCRGLSKKWRGQRGQFLPAATIQQLWAALDRLQARMPDACDAVRLLILTGARRSEILALEWDAIAGPRAVLKDSKEGPRTIWLNSPARAILDARKAVATGQYVFPAPICDGPLKIIDRAWATIRAEAGIGPLRVHDLRHHFASIAVSNGMDLHLVGQLLGHHEIDSTLGYAHLATDALMKSATRVSGVIDRSLRGGATRNKQTRSPKRSAIAKRPAASREEARHG